MLTCTASTNVLPLMTEEALPAGKLSVTTFTLVRNAL